MAKMSRSEIIGECRTRIVLMKSWRCFQKSGAWDSLRKRVIRFRYRTLHYQSSRGGGRAAKSVQRAAQLLKGRLLCEDERGSTQMHRSPAQCAEHHQRR